MNDILIIGKSFVHRRWATLLQEHPQNRKLDPHSHRKLRLSASEVSFRKIVSQYIFFSSFCVSVFLHTLYLCALTFLDVSVQHMMYGFGDDPNVSIYHFKSCSFHLLQDRGKLLFLFIFWFLQHKYDYENWRKAWLFVSTVCHRFLDSQETIFFELDFFYTNCLDMLIGLI